MSTSLGIAAVTAVLRDILTNRVASDPAASAIGSVTVSCGAPDRIDLTGSADPNQINLFLYQVTQNPGWANTDLPSRNSSGQRIKNPPLALDLHFLISVYGAQPYFAELLLGEVVQEFYERPVPDRQIIDRALNPSSPPSGFPTQLAQSGLSRQIERIRIIPEALNSEEVSKLWSALQACYRTTVAYQVCTVLIESSAPSRPALPVRRILGYSFTYAVPAIHTVESADGPGVPIVAGSSIVIKGVNFTGENLGLMLQELDISAQILDKTENRIELTLPDPLPSGIHAGVNTFRVVNREPISDPVQLRNTSFSNPGVFIITPTLGTIVPTVTSMETMDSQTYKSGSFQVTFSPPILSEQKVALLLNPLNPSTPGCRAYRFQLPDGNEIVAPSSEASTVAASFSRVAAGTYMVRIEIDRAASMLTIDSGGVFNGPVVVI
jgi:hypothetical protein